MTPRNKYIEEQMKDWRTKRFRAHQARFLEQPDPTRTHNNNALWLINWQKSGTWVYGMRFIITGQWLCVMGDAGEATYQWSETITPGFLSGLDFGYFRSKCQASPTGRRWDDFDHEVGLAELRSCEDPMVIEYPALREIIHSGKFPDKDTWDLMCQEVYDHAGDAELASMLSELPMVPHTMQIGHFVGMQMALEQLYPGGFA